MVENTENVVSLKVAETDRDWLEKEQVRLRGVEGRKPTQAEMFRRMAEAYAEATKRAAARPETDGGNNPLSEVDRKYTDHMKKAARIFSGRHPKISVGLAHNVDLFDELFEFEERHGAQRPRS